MDIGDTVLALHGGCGVWQRCLCGGMDFPCLPPVGNLWVYIAFERYERLWAFLSRHVALGCYHGGYPDAFWMAHGLSLC